MIDQYVLEFFSVNRIEWLSFLILTITYAGGYMIVGLVTTLSCISFYTKRHFLHIQTLLISLGGSLITTYILKELVDRQRPIKEALYIESTNSFPSGHATVAIALYGFLLYVIWKHEKHHLKNKMIIFLSLLIFSIGFSRLYLGVHYLSDVMAGYAVGLIWLLISLAISKSKLLQPLVREHRE